LPTKATQKQLKLPAFCKFFTMFQQKQLLAFQPRSESFWNCEQKRCSAAKSFGIYQQKELKLFWSAA
jgi:hypothetical protein